MIDQFDQDGRGNLFDLLQIGGENVQMASFAVVVSGVGDVHQSLLDLSFEEIRLGQKRIFVETLLPFGGEEKRARVRCRIEWRSLSTVPERIRRNRHGDVWCVVWRRTATDRVRCSGR